MENKGLQWRNRGMPDWQLLESPENSIYFIRKKMGHEIIQNIRGYGYKFKIEVGQKQADLKAVSGPFHIILRKSREK